MKQEIKDLLLSDNIEQSIEAYAGERVDNFLHKFFAFIGVLMVLYVIVKII